MFYGCDDCGQEWPIELMEQRCWNEAQIFLCPDCKTKQESLFTHPRPEIVCTLCGDNHSASSCWILEEGV